MTLMTNYSHMCTIGRGSINCKLTLSLRKVFLVSQNRGRACRTVTMCWGARKASVLKILPALHSNCINAGLCWNLAELLGILLMRSFPILPSVLSVSFFHGYTSFPELHRNCSDSVSLLQLLQCYSMPCGDRKQGPSCHFHSNFANAHQMSNVPYLFFF